MPRLINGSEHINTFNTFTATTTLNDNDFLNELFRGSSLTMGDSIFEQVRRNQSSSRLISASGINIGDVDKK
jgi:hypothetical protein